MSAMAAVRNELAQQKERDASKTDTAKTKTAEGCPASENQQSAPNVFQSALELLIRGETGEISTWTTNILAISEPCALQHPVGEQNGSFC